MKNSLIQFNVSVLTQDNTVQVLPVAAFNESMAQKIATEVLTGQVIKIELRK